MYPIYMFYGKYSKRISSTSLMMFIIILILATCLLLFSINRIRRNPLKESMRGMSYQETSLFDQEYVDPDDGEPKVKRFINDTVRIWSKETIDDFKRFQARENPDVLFDMDIIQQQTTEEDAKRMIRDGKWYWSPRTIEIYDNAITQNNMTKKSPFKGRLGDQTIYNENAILRMLALNAPEGHFLLYGRRITNPEYDVSAKPYSGRGSYGVRSGLVQPDISRDTIQCNNNKLQKKHFTGYDGIYGQAVFETTDVDPKTLPSLYKDFSFIEEPCNPCVGLQFPYVSDKQQCKFSIRRDKKVSPSWEKIWGMDPSPIPKLPRGFPYWIN